MLEYSCRDMRNKYKKFAGCRKGEITNNQCFVSSRKPVIESIDGEYSSFGNYNCYTEPLTLGCMIH